MPWLLAAARLKKWKVRGYVDNGLEKCKLVIVSEDLPNSDQCGNTEQCTTRVLPKHVRVVNPHYCNQTHTHTHTPHTHTHTQRDREREMKQRKE